MQRAEEEMVLVPGAHAAHVRHPEEIDFLVAWTVALGQRCGLEFGVAQEGPPRTAMDSPQLPRIRQETGPVSEM
jgi:hypothetical protein